MTDATRDLLIKLTSHMAYMQGQLEARHELDDLEDYYWYRESVLLRQQVADVLADEPAVPDGREPASVATQPSDEEIMELMPQQMHDDLAAAVRAMAAQEGIDSIPAKGVLRIMLNRHVVDLTRAVLARWGRPAAPPTPAAGEAPTPSEQLVEQWVAEVWHEGTPVRVAASDLHIAAKAAEWGARWGRRPAPPADGEVGDLVEEMRELVYDVSPYSADLLTRAAELLEQRHPAPVPVSERLPEPNTKVLAHYFNSLGKGRTVCAIWVPAKSRSDDFDLSDDDFTEYDEETDKFYWPEGWYETIENWDDLGYVKIYEGEVIYWQPLPQWPAHALPLPGEVTS